MGLEYNDQHDAMMRLDGTICMYEGFPFYVQVLPEKHCVSLFSLGDMAKVKTVKYTEDLFSYKPFPLGYMNMDNTSYFLSRSPDRRQKQGLASGLVRFKDRKPHGNWFPSMALQNCIRGEYPKRIEAENSVIVGVNDKCAFHRHLAVRRLNAFTLELLFRDRVIGFKGHQDAAYKLYDAPDASFLYRTLPSMGVPL